MIYSEISDDNSDNTNNGKNEPLNKNLTIIEDDK